VKGDGSSALSLWRGRLAFLLLAALATVAVSCGGGDDRFSIDDEVGAFSPRWTDAAPTWSRDGKGIAFASDRHRKRHKFDLYVMESDGTGVRRLTTIPVREDEQVPPFTGRFIKNVRWSPDGRSIAFVVVWDYGDWNPAELGLYVVRVRDGKPTVLVSRDRAAEALDYAWSPDSSTIAFLEPLHPDTARVIDPRGGRPQRLSDGEFSSLQWFPDSSRVALFSLEAISIVDVRRRNEETLVRLEDGADEGSLSPDGRKIAFESGYEMYVMNVDGSERRRVTNTERADYDPAWSPDSSKIAFVSGRDLEEPHFFTTELYVADATGSGLRRITKHDEDIEDSNATWSPDGEWLTFDRGGEAYIIRPDGSRERPFPRDFSWAPDGSEVAFAYRGAIFAMRADGTRVRMLTQPSRGKGGG
jgi:Tol biopolymer transport system component